MRVPLQAGWSVDLELSLWALIWFSPAVGNDTSSEKTIDEWTPLQHFLALRLIKHFFVNMIFIVS